MASREGSKNKNKQFLLAKLKDMYGAQFDPIMRAAELADSLHRHLQESAATINAVTDPVEKAKMFHERSGLICDAIDKWCKIGEFTNGKVSAITLSQDPDNPVFRAIDSDMPHAEATRVYKDTLKQPSSH